MPIPVSGFVLLCQVDGWLAQQKNVPKNPGVCRVFHEYLCINTYYGHINWCSLLNFPFCVDDFLYSLADGLYTPLPLP